MPRSEYIIRKFGGEDRARRLYSTITEVGRREGLDFRFDRIRRTPSSIDAHRLVRYASRFSRANVLVEGLFRAHFSDGWDLGDHQVLASVAADCGLEVVATQRFLATEDEANSVHADNLLAHRLGINGVPCFVMEGTYAIAGAQEPEVIERLLDVALAHPAPL